MTASEGQIQADVRLLMLTILDLQATRCNP